MLITELPRSPSLSTRYYLYKLPNQKGSKDPARGLMYLLLEKGSEGWTEGKFNANSTAGAPGRTVGQLYGSHKVWLSPSMPSFCL